MDIEKEHLPMAFQQLVGVRLGGCERVQCRQWRVRRICGDCKDRLVRGGEQ